MSPSTRVGAAALLFSARVTPAPPTPSAPASATVVPSAPAPPPATTPAAAADDHDPGRWLPFPARGIGATSGRVDLSALDEMPAGARGFIHPSAGHFVDGTGVRVRFFGVD